MPSHLSARVAAWAALVILTGGFLSIQTLPTQPYRSLAWRAPELTSHCPVQSNKRRVFHIGPVVEFFWAYGPDDEYIPLKTRFLHCSKNI